MQDFMREERDAMVAASGKKSRVDEVDWSVIGKQAYDGICNQSQHITNHGYPSIFFRFFLFTFLTAKLHMVAPCSTHKANILDAQMMLFFEPKPELRLMEEHRTCDFWRKELILEV